MIKLHGWLASFSLFFIVVELEIFKITLDECDTWRSNRGSRPDGEMDDKAMKVLKEYKIENLSQATIEVYCDELERRTEETAADKVFYDDSSSSSSISSSVESDYDSNAEKELRNFPDRMYDTVNDEAANDLITNLEICEAYPSVCCPLFESFGDIYSTGAFSNETIDALNSAEIKSECAKYEFMSCCVFTDLCSIYPNLAHCQPANSAALVEAVKLQFRAASSTSTSTTTTSTTSTSTTTTSTSTKKTTSDVVNSDVEPVTNDQSFGDSDSSTDIPINDKIIGATDENGQNGGGVSTKSPEEIQEIEEDAASRGITILIVVIGLIVLMAIAVIVSKHFFAGDGEEPVAAGEDDSLLVTNATQKPLDQIPEDNEAQQVQQQTEEEPVQQQAQEEQFQQQQVQN